MIPIYIYAPSFNSAVASALSHSDIMGPASDSVVLFKESDFGITDPDVDSSARTAASHSDTVATFSDFVILTTASHSVIILSPSVFVVLITASSFVIVVPLPLISGSYYVFRTKHLFSYYGPTF